MKIVLISKTDFSVIQVNNVTNIAFSGGNIIVTGSQNVTVSEESYYIQILW